MATAPLRNSSPRNGRIFSLDDWISWLDYMARSLFGLSGEQFEAAYAEGRFAGRGVADDVASILPLIQKLRQTDTYGQG